MTIPYAIFASGSGSNAISLIKKGMSDGHRPAFLLCNIGDAPVIKKAEALGIKVIVIESANGRADDGFESDVLTEMKRHQVSWVFLAGFMKILSARFLQSVKDHSVFHQSSYFPVVNIHPSLLPEFSGLAGYERAFAAGREEYGFSIHLVDEKVDHGPILFQCCIKRLQTDSVEDFKSKGLHLENKFYPLVVQKILEENNFVEDRILNPRIIHEDTHDSEL